MTSESGDRKYLLAVDHGTSAMKVALTDSCGEVLAFEFEENKLDLLPGGGAEQDPDEWWTTLLSCSRKLVEGGYVRAEQIAGICVSSQWSGTVAVDVNGNHLHNAIIWMDTRGEPHIKKALKGIINIQGYSITNLLRWLRKTGGIPAGAGKDPIAHILWLKNDYPEVYEKTHKFLECKDYLNMKLTGVFAASYDSIMLHWLTDTRDIWNISYDQGLMKKLGVDPGKFPSLVGATDILGDVTEEVADQIGVLPDTKVVTGSSDLHSAIIGSGAVRDFEGHIYIGTSSWITCHVPFKKTDISHNMASLPSPVPGRYFVANEQESAGACLTFLRDNLLYIDDPERFGRQEVYQEFDRIAETVPAGSNKMIFTPWLYGERTPVEDHTLRGGLHNISLPVKRADIIRAVFEGVAYNSRWLMELVEKFIKRRMDSLNIIGGGAQSDIWCQIYADVLNRTIRRVKDPIYANARGAALIGAVGLGLCSFDDIPNLIQIERDFTPNPENRALYDEMFSEFLNIYKTHQKMYSRLNK